MREMPKKIPGILLNPALDLDELENEIRAALRTAWIMLGLLLLTSCGIAAGILAQQFLR